MMSKRRDNSINHWSGESPYFNTNSFQYSQNIAWVFQYQNVDPHLKAAQTLHVWSVYTYIDPSATTPDLIGKWVIQGVGLGHIKGVKQHHCMATRGRVKSHSVHARMVWVV